MIHYTNPRYKIRLQKNGIYKVDVKAKQAAPPPMNIPLARYGVLVRQARKDPLLAMAFVNWLAKKGDLQAKNLCHLYRGYCHLMSDPQGDALLIACESLLKSPKTDPLARDAADWILLTLNRHTIPKRLTAAARLINTLIPALYETLLERPLKIVYPPQEVTLPEITAKHKAFPDLVKFKDEYFACFREAHSHAGYKDNGKIRILKGSFDTTARSWKWRPAGLLSSKGIDLRDPRFFIKENTTLNLICGGSTIGKDDETVTMSPHIATWNGSKWDFTKAVIDPSCDGDNGQWIWRVTWNGLDHKGYAFAYGQDTRLNLVGTKEGTSFRKIATIECPPLTELNEGTLRFKSDGTAFALIRTRRNGIVAFSSFETGYTEWTCSMVPFRLGGPDFLIDEKRKNIWAATRYFFINPDNTLDEATIVAKMHPSKLIPLLRLPSSYDCSYPGIVLEEDGSLTIIYYSGSSPSSCKVIVISVKSDIGT